MQNFTDQCQKLWTSHFNLVDNFKKLICDANLHESHYHNFQLLIIDDSVEKNHKERIFSTFPKTVQRRFLIHAAKLQKKKFKIFPF